MLTRVKNKLAGFWLLFFSLLCRVAGFSQPLPNEDKLTINRFFNEIGNKEKLLPLFQKLQNCRQQSCMLSVLHLGDSHVKSKYYSRSMEAALNVFFNQQEHVYKVNDSTAGRQTYFFNLQEYAVVGTKFQDYYNSTALSQYLSTNLPDLMIVSLGTNDAYSGIAIDRMSDQMQQLIQLVKAASPGTVLLFTTPPDERKPIPTRDGSNRLETVRQTIINNCTADTLAYWNLYSVMGGMGTMRNWQRWGFATTDNVHYTGIGYTVFGRLLAEAIFGCYQKLVLQ
jgi:lysophospholipase L1-like esterase